VPFGTSFSVWELTDLFLQYSVMFLFFPAIGCWVWKTRYWVFDGLLLDLTLSDFI
jgi:hypothetical protein